MTRTNPLHVALAAMALAACGGPRPPDPKPTLEPDNVQPDERPSITVIEPGAQPRRPARLSLTSGATTTVEFLLEQTRAIEIAGGQSKSPMSTMWGRMTATVKSVDERGVGAIQYEITDADILDRPGLGAQILANEQAFEQAIDATGHKVKRATDVASDESENQSTLATVIQQSSVDVEFPRRPIGVGAMWRERTTTTPLGAPIEIVKSYRLRARDGDTLSIEVTVEAQGLPIALDTGGLGGNRTDIQLTRLSGSFAVTVDVTRAYPTSLKGTVANTIKTLAGQPKSASEIVEHSSTTMTIAQAPPGLTRETDALRAAISEELAQCDGQIMGMGQTLQRSSRRPERGAGVVPTDLQAPRVASGWRPIIEPAAIVRVKPGSKAVTLLRRADDARNLTVVHESKAVDRSFRRALRGEIARITRETRSRPLVLIAANSFDQTSAISPIARAIGKRARVGLIVEKPIQARMDELLAVVPSTPAWVQDEILAYFTARPSVDLTDVPLSEFVPPVLRASGTCSEIPSVFVGLVNGQAFEVAFPALIEYVKACRCRGLDAGALQALMFHISHAGQHHGWVPLPTNPRGGRIVELAHRAVGLKPPNITDTTAQPPPGTPKVVSPNTVQSNRIAGDPAIAPPMSVRAAIKQAGKTQVVAVVKLCLSADGAVSSTKVVKSSGFPDYDEEILAGMATWRYKPFIIDGKPAPVCTAVTFVYRQTD